MRLTVKYCCFCGGLRTGSLIFAYLILFRDIIVTLTSIIIIALKDTIPRGLYRVMIYVDILLAFGIVNVMMGIVLIIGIHKYINACLRAHLIFNLIQMVVAAALILIFCLLSGLPGFNILCLIFLASYVYYLMVIRSYSLEMDDSSNKPAVFHTISTPPAYEFVVLFKPEEKDVTNNMMS